MVQLGETAAQTSYEFASIGQILNQIDNWGNFLCGQLCVVGKLDKKFCTNMLLHSSEWQ